ncbi:MAG: PAS domain-containing protein [Desulfohalobiaceae bacterium]|nr:PAS domain-containing protein [Desulfohalobiaceae bacterium]
MTANNSLQKEELGNELLAKFFNNSPIGIYILQDRVYKFINPEFLRITGYTEQELKKIDPLSMVHPEDRDMTRRKAIKMLKGKRNSPYLTRIITKRGQTRHILESVSSINYYGRRATLSYFMDNTEQELIKQALWESEEKFEKAFRSSPDWVVISTLDDGIYLEVNQNFLQTTGYEQYEVIGRSSAELGIWADLNQRDELHDILREKGRVKNAEVRFNTKSGRTIHVLWSAEVIDYKGRECLIAVTRDITDRKRAEEEKLKREKLQAVVETAGATCHELTQPMQTIFMLLEEIKKENPESYGPQEMEKQINRIRTITSKLQNITSYETKDYVQGSRIIDLEKSSSSVKK